MSARLHARIAFVASLILAATVLIPPAYAAVDPATETLAISRLLKPIADSDWKSIAGPRTAERYTIASGDTLWNISARLFGDPHYWPKIWALNNDSITNPHLILPGNLIAFLPGSGGSLPGVAIETRTDAPEEPETAPRRYAGGTQEWRNLPRQRWENVDLQRSASIDPDGFDRRSKVSRPRRTGFDLPALAYTSRPDPLGIVVGAHNSTLLHSTNDGIYIKAATGKSLQIGQEYAVLSNEPRELFAKKSGREGYSYIILGTVKPFALEGDTYAARITGNRSAAIPRGALLVDVPPRIQNLTPIPGPAPLVAHVILDRTFSTFSTSQFKPLFLDLGTADGIQPNMLFTFKQKVDPYTQKAIAKDGLFTEGEILVVQTSERVSQGVVITSLNPVPEGETVTLQTSIDKKAGARRKEIIKLEESSDAAPLPAATGEPQALTPAEAETPTSTPAASGDNIPEDPGTVPPSVSESELPPIETLDQELDVPEDIDITLDQATNP